MNFWSEGFVKELLMQCFWSRKSLLSQWKGVFLVDVLGRCGRCNEGGGREFAPLTRGSNGIVCPSSLTESALGKSSPLRIFELWNPWVVL
jgi:hypothetical protein